MRTHDQLIELHGVSWETYQGLLRSDESQRGSVRMSYDRGRLVLMAPSLGHEHAADRLGLMVRLTAAGLGMRCMGIGRTTLLREKTRHGKEPDNAYYLANEPRVRGKRREFLDSDEDLPPDLAIEVEIKHHDPGMFDVYAALGVPEIWHYHGERLRALQLQPDGSYAAVAASPSLPLLPLHEVPGRLKRADIEGESAMMPAFLDRVRNELAPRQAGEEGAG